MTITPTKSVEITEPCLYDVSEKEQDSGLLTVKIFQANRHDRENKCFYTLGKFLYMGNLCELIIVHKVKVPNFSYASIFKIKTNPIRLRKNDKDARYAYTTVVYAEDAVFAKIVDGCFDCYSDSIQRWGNMVAVATPFVVTAIASTPTVAGPIISLGMAVTAINEITKKK